MHAAIAFFILLVLIAPPVHAQHVYKCAKGRDVSYQSAPCDGTQSLVKQWEAAPEPEPSAAEFSQHAPKGRQRGANSAGNRTRFGSHGRTTSPISAADNRCRAAKERREAKLIAVGLKRTFDLLRKLDDAVHEACK
ncbi:MAG TPA: hypothetical protein VF471_02330 [Pseudoxanthomonas sp.]